MALCVSTSESVHACVWCSGRKEKTRNKKKKKATSTNEIKEALTAALKTPTCRWGELNRPPSSSFLCKNVEGWLQMKIIAGLNNCTSIIRVILMSGNLHFLLSPHQGVMALKGCITFSTCCCCRLTANGGRAAPPARGASRNHSSFLRRECDTTAAAVHQRPGKVSMDPLSFFLRAQSFIAATQRPREHQS